jgi:hypothetical protein
MTALIEQLAQQFDIVLLDTPALLAVTDVAVLAPAVDGVVLVVGRAQARREAVQAACQQLTDVRARPVGAVVNRAGQDGSYTYYRRAPARRDGRTGIFQKLRKKHVLAGGLGLTLVCLVVGRLVAGSIWQAVPNTPTPLPVVFEPTPTFTVILSPTPTRTVAPSPTPTATPSPTFTPIPTATPAPATGVMVGSVWLRGGPSADSPRMGLILERDQPVEILAIFGDWAQVRWVPQAQAEVIGWVPARWVETTVPVPSRIVTPVAGLEKE